MLWPALGNGTIKAISNGYGTLSEEVLSTLER